MNPNDVAHFRNYIGLIDFLYDNLKKKAIVDFNDFDTKDLEALFFNNNSYDDFMSDLKQFTEQKISKEMFVKVKFLALMTYNYELFGLDKINSNFPHRLDIYTETYKDNKDLVQIKIVDNDPTREAWDRQEYFKDIFFIENVNPQNLNMNFIYPSKDENHLSIKPVCLTKEFVSLLNKLHKKDKIGFDIREHKEEYADLAFVDAYKYNLQDCFCDSYSIGSDNFAFFSKEKSLNGFFPLFSKDTYLGNFSLNDFEELPYEMEKRFEEKYGVTYNEIREAIYEATDYTQAYLNEAQALLDDKIKAIDPEILEKFAVVCQIEKIGGSDNSTTHKNGLFLLPRISNSYDDDDFEIKLSEGNYLIQYNIPTKDEVSKVEKAFNEVKECMFESYYNEIEQNIQNLVEFKDFVTKEEEQKEQDWLSSIDDKEQEQKSTKKHKR